MRGTLHFVAAADIRWILDLLAGRNLSGGDQRSRELGLDEAVFSRSRKLIVRELEGNRQLTRDAAVQVLERGGVRVDGQAGYHILRRLAQEGIICFATREGKQHTFALIDEWVPKLNKPGGEEALAELARRYFNTHGPATLRDYVWWSGLKVSDAKAGLASIAGELARFEAAGETWWMSQTLPEPAGNPKAVHLLPGFDQYLLGYKDRSAVLDARHAPKIVPGGNGMFLSTIVVRGRVTGTWKREIRKGCVAFKAAQFGEENKLNPAALATAAGRYGKFLGMPVEIS